MGDLISVMDHLWFHQIILFSASTTTTTTTTTAALLISKPLKQHPPQVLINSGSLTDTSSSSCNSLSSSTHTNGNEDISPSTSSLLLPLEPQLSSDSPPPHLDDLNKEEEEEKKDYCSVKKERPIRVNKIKNRARSHSSSPFTYDHSKHEKDRGGSPGGRRKRAAALKKLMSCRSLGDLELEEVKGFMDLGFIFKKEHLNPRMLTLIPGLQRLGCYNKNPKPPIFGTTCNTSAASNTALVEDNNTKNGFNGGGEEEEGGSNVSRPYLSEAWLVRKPNSPLLNLRLPRETAAADMKKHLVFWARTVASEIQ